MFLLQEPEFYDCRSRLRSPFHSRRYAHMSIHTCVHTCVHTDLIHQSVGSPDCSSCHDTEGIETVGTVR